MSTSGSREAAFIGKITASATHEIRNVLAIVKESAGLIDDLVRMAADRGSLDGDRVFKATQRIDAQVARGADLITGLNRFAHSLDHDRQAIDLGEEIRQVVFLSQRFARKKSQSVRAVPGAEPRGFTANSLAVQMALFAVLELLMEELQDGAAIDVRWATVDGLPAAEMTATLNDVAVSAPGAGAAWERTRSLVQDLGAALEVTESDRALTLLFRGEG
jgi:signal transduction histidine kinase